MIKVTNTKKHVISRQVWPASTDGYTNASEALVAEGKLVLVEMEGISDFRAKSEGGKQLEDYYIKMSNLCYYKPLIISEHENTIGCEGPIIRAFDNAILIDNVNSDNRKGEKFYKILVLPEHFSPEQLQLIVDGVYKDGDKLNVECEHYYTSALLPSEQYLAYKIKLNQQGHCIFYKAEEAKPDTSCTLGVGDGTGQHFVHGDYDSIKVLQAKLLKMEKMYTKEEVMEIASNWAVYCRDTDFIEALTREEWFNNNVK